MSKFLKTCHVISRIFVYLCVIAVLLLYFFKPGILDLARTVVPTADNGAWLATVTTLAFAAVMFAASELACKSLQDNEFMATLSSSLLKPAFVKYDLGTRFSRIAKGEKELNACLRDVTDGKERVMQELAWEKQNCKKLQKRTVGNKIVMLFFLLAGLAFFLYPVVFYLVTKKLLWTPTGTLLDYFSLVALILTMVIVFEIGNNQGLLRRLNTVLAIRGRSDDLDKPTTGPVQPEAVPTAPIYLYSAPAPAAPVAPVPAAPAPAASTLVQEEAPAPAAATVTTPAPSPLPPEEIWHPETWNDVPEETPAEEETSASAFIHLTPEEPAENESES